MDFLAKEIVDLTRDHEDEVKCIGSVTHSVTIKSPSKLQAAQQIAVDHVDKSATLSPLNRRSELPSSGGSESVTTDNLLNSTWDGFAKPRQRIQSTVRTPSPFTGECMGPSGKHGIGVPHSPNGEKKRFRQNSLSICGKRVRYSSLISIDNDTNPEDTESLKDGEYDVYRGSPSPIAREATAEELDHGVIILENEEDLEEIMETSSESWHEIAKKKGRPSLKPEYLVIDVDDQEDALLQEIEMLAPRETISLGRSDTVIVSRNLPIALPWITRQSYQAESIGFEVGDVVELKSSGFLRIMIIMMNAETDVIKLRGCSLERTRELNGMLPKKLNELYMTIEVELDDPRDPSMQGMMEVDLSQVLAVRETRMTNQVFPGYSYRQTGGFYNDKEILLNAPCAVRWKYTCRYLTARDRWHNRWYERCIEHLKANDLSGDGGSGLNMCNDVRIRSRYRGDTVLGGAFRGSETSYNSKTSITKTSRRESNNAAIVVVDDDSAMEQARRSVSVMDLSHKDQGAHSVPKEHGNFNKKLKNRSFSSVQNTVDLSNSVMDFPPREGFAIMPAAQLSESVSNEMIRRSPGQRYTYGDCFCGAGGATRGAVMAGLKVIWGFDKDIHACNSWKLNFPQATLYQEWADQLIQRELKSSRLRADILHLSPPCQVFSPAHTVEGQDDEMNMASLFACGMLLDVAKPRIATLEQTFGIVLLPRFHIYFNALVQMFTDRGFSIRWKICHLQDWGLPQRRQRLIIIASCPGEVLPEFPPFTHVDPRKRSNRLAPWVSVNSIIQKIPRNAPNHDVDLMEARPFNCRPWSGESIAPRCITTHGGHNYHPDGKRGFTLREFASLQGFPMIHRFSQVNVKKQIGNAVPPCVAQVLFSWIRKALEKADGILPEDEKSEILQAGNFQSDAIILD